MNKLEISKKVVVVEQKRITREREKYLNLFLHKIKIEGVNDTWVENYIKRELYFKGTLAFFKTLAGDGIIGVAPYANQMYGYCNRPININLINERGINIIPSKPQIVDKEAVIIWTQPNRKSVYEMIDQLIKDIVDIDMTIDTALFSSKLPLIIGVDITDQDAVDNIMRKLAKNEPVILTKLKDVNSLKGITNNSNYIIDKLQAQKQVKEGEILTYFGFDNVNFEKRERLLVSEVESNNDIIEEHKNLFIDSINSGLEVVNKVLGYNLRAVLNIAEPDIKIESKENENEEDSTKEDKGDNL